MGLLYKALGISERGMTHGGTRVILGRYTMRQFPDENVGPPPVGIHKDTRKHQNHCLSPTPEMVKKYLSDPTAGAWTIFRSSYLELLEKHFAERKSEFDELANLAMKDDVYIGCSCPTKNNPSVYHCHTVLALQFMKEIYPQLTVVMPSRIPKSK